MNLIKDTRKQNKDFAWRDLIYYANSLKQNRLKSIYNSNSLSFFWFSNIVSDWVEHLMCVCVSKFDTPQNHTNLYFIYNVLI